MKLDKGVSLEKNKAKVNGLFYYKMFSNVAY